MSLAGLIVAAAALVENAQNISSETLTLMPKPTTFYVEFQVHNLEGSPDKGRFGIEVFPELAPISAERFKQMARETIFDRSHIYRVVPGVGCLFGISGNPHSAKRWRKKAVDYDPVEAANDEGMVSFAHFGETSGALQIWVNFANNPQLDEQGFAPFGKVTKGLDLLRRTSAAYGPGPDSPAIPLPGVTNGHTDKIDGGKNCAAGVQTCEGPSLEYLHDQDFNMVDYKFPNLSWIMAADFIQHTSMGHAVAVGQPHIDWPHEAIQRWHRRHINTKAHDEL